MDQMLLAMSGMGFAAAQQHACESGNGPTAAGTRQRFRLVRTLEVNALEVGLLPASFTHENSPGNALPESREGTGIFIHAFLIFHALFLPCVISQGRSKDALHALLNGSPPPMTGPGSERATESSPSCSTSSDARQKSAPVASDDRQGSVPFERTTAPHDGLNESSADPIAGSSLTQHRPRLDPRAVGSHSIVEGEPSTAQQAMMRGLARQLSSAARYKQVRSRRQQFTSGEADGARSQRGVSEVENAGSGGGGGPEAEAEGLFLYDFVCTDVDEGVAAKKAKAGRRKAAQERMKRVAEEGAILMNYLPMVRSLGAVLFICALPLSPIRGSHMCIIRPKLVSLDRPIQ